MFDGTSLNFIPELSLVRSTRETCAFLLRTKASSNLSVHTALIMSRFGRKIELMAIALDASSFGLQGRGGSRGSEMVQSVSDRRFIINNIGEIMHAMACPSLWRERSLV